ncbi:hypothetical protein [Lysinibacillus antri]|uniref:DUF2325 domain-containing protein n=1 Tax=Lysinibacillus antri TaxID=2498145 RepID=A0A3S0WFA9_9BACI|nr:hypothetical protein [Lysinibacillus antri]RUL50472.1 hypothetical protein EK386_13880 [Lysinibacillus antri]
MTTVQMKAHYPTNNERGFTKPDILFFANIHFSLEHLLKELPQEAILLFHSLIEQFEERDPNFFETLNDRKKWETALKKYSHLKLKPSQFTKVFDEVCTFFSKKSSNHFIYEIADYFRIATYETEGKASWFSFDNYDGESIPFTSERIDSNDGIQFHDVNGEKKSISPHVLMVIRLLDDEAMKRLEIFKIKAKLDETIPEHIQLLLATCLDDERTNAFMKVLTNPLATSIQAVISYYKLFRFLEDAYTSEQDEEIEYNISTYYAQLRQQFYRIVSSNYLLYVSSKRERDEKSAASNKAKLEETVEKLEKQKELNKELKKQQAELKKQQKEIKAPPKQIMEQLSNPELEQLTENLKSLHLRYKRLEQEKSRDESRLDQEIKKLKQDNSTLQKKLQPLLKITEQPKIETIPQWLELGRELIQNINEVEEQQIREFFEFFLIVCEEQKALRPKQELASNLFGYVSVSKEGHYIHLGDGKEERISGIPVHIYLADGQFVQVTSDFQYVQDYPDFLDGSLHGQAFNFSVVKMKDDLPYVYSNGTLKAITHEPSIQLRDGQIVSFNSENELIRFYKKQRLQLDLFEESIKLKKHEPYFVQKVLPTGAVVTNAFTKEESFITFSNAEELQDGQLITTIDHNIIRTFSGAFYKLSSFYGRSELVSVCENDDVCFGKKLSREIVIIKNIPSHVTISVGDTIRIDEWHNYLELVKSEVIEEETLEKRLSRRSASTNKETITPVAHPEIKSSGLIVGNPAFFENYGQQFNQYGYDIEGMDGYESFSRIKHAAKDKDFIVVCTGFISHDNMYAIKDTFPSNQVIYTERDGATQIALKLKSSNF